jgi:uncharacterized membrane protein
MARRQWVLLWVLLVPTWLLAQRYVTVDAPGTPVTNTTVNGISPRSNILVGSFQEIPSTKGFVLRNGKFQIVDHPVATSLSFTVASDVNDFGLVIGYYADFVIPVVPPVHGFAFLNGNFTPIDFPGGVDTYPIGINNFGQVVGKIQDSRCDGIFALCNRRGFPLSHGQFTAIEFPGAAATYAQGINNRGVVVGSYQNLDGPIHGFTFLKGTFGPLDCPTPGASMSVSGINDFGDIVATCDRSSVLLAKRTAHTIAFPGAALTVVSGVGNRDHDEVPVVGFYVDTAGAQHGFYGLIPLRHNGEREED